MGNRPRNEKFSITPNFAQVNTHFDPFARLISWPDMVIHRAPLVLGILLGPAWFSHAAVDWPTLGFSPVGTNAFSHPTCITHAGDGSQRLFVLEQFGKIWFLPPGNPGALLFLDVTDRV